MNEELFKKGFLIIRSLIDKNTINKIYDYTKSIKINGDFNDGQVSGTSSFYNDKTMTELQNKYHEKIESEIDMKLIKTYNYFRIYDKGAVLHKHKDRDACEISLTINIGYEDKPWGIWIKDKNNNENEIILEPGDACVYLGCECEHWRELNTFSDNHSQLFMHFVNANGLRTWAVSNENK